MSKLLNKTILALIVAAFTVGCGPTASSEDNSSGDVTSQLPTTSEDDSLTSEDPSSEEGGDGIVGTPIAPGEVPAFVDLYVNPGSIEFERYQVWLWDDGGTNGTGYNWDSVEGDWAYIRLDMATFNAKNELGVIVRQKTTWDGQSQDGFIKFSEFGQVDGVMSVYVIIGDGNVLEFYHRASDALGDQFYSGNSYNIGYETNSYKWNDKIKWLPYFNAYKDLINLRLSEEGEFLRLASASEVGNNFRYWQRMIPALSWSAVASENKFNASSYTSSGAIYGFYVARIAENDVTKETFKWAADGAQVKVIYDSKGELTAQILTDQVAMERFRVILEERL